MLSSVSCSIRSSPTAGEEPAAISYHWKRSKQAAVRRQPKHGLQTHRALLSSSYMVCSCGRCCSFSWPCDPAAVRKSAAHCDGTDPRNATTRRGTSNSQACHAHTRRSPVTLYVTLREKHCFASGTAMHTERMRPVPTVPEYMPAQNIMLDKRH